MSVEVTFLGHSGFLLSAGTHQLLVDPFLSGNPLAKHKPDDIKCTHIALTHGHEDHVGDAVDIAKRTGATCIGVFELCNYLGEQGVPTDHLEPANPGGKIVTPFGWVAFTQAFHSSSHSGKYMGQPTGLVIEIGGVTIYHAGDTGLFSDMKLIGEIYRPDVACLPVGDRFTMGPELATRAAEMIQPRVAIPIHYKTFPLLRQDCAGFTPRGVEVKELAPGERWTFG